MKKCLAVIKTGKIFLSGKKAATCKKTFTQMWQTLGKEVFQRSIGELPQYKNRKKTPEVLDYILQKIIIADGARWIWKWAEERCSEATPILDFCHAKEHLCRFAE